MHTVSHADLVTLLSALAAVVPVGGGSDALCVLHRVQNATGVEVDYDLSNRFAQNVVEEFQALDA